MELEEGVEHLRAQRDSLVVVAVQDGEACDEARDAGGLGAAVFPAVF